MTTLRSDLRGLIAKYGLPAVHAELQAEMRETYDFLRQMFEPSKNNLVIPMTNMIPDRVATPHLKPIQVVLPPDPPALDLTPEEGEQDQTDEKDMSLKEVVIQAKSEMNREMFGEKFSKAKHREEVAKKHKEVSEKGIKPESLLTKENLTQWLGSGMSYMRIAREIVGVHENEIAAVAKTFGLQSDIKKYIVMKKGGK
jgi:hypothetical protein